MTKDLRDFWARFQSGLQVAVGSDLPDKLLGVRDGFLRYFRDGLERPVPIAVVPKPQDEEATPIPIQDAEILELARARCRRVYEEHTDGFDFHVGVEAGVLTLQAGDERRTFVRSWAVVRGLGEEAWGSSGSIQWPERLIEGLDAEQVPFTIPGTRRSGGLVASLTGQLETRRSTTALATLHAIATLLYGRLESRALRRRR